MEQDQEQRGGAQPLSGFRIIEFAGIGPGPFAGMLLSDMGAEVIRIDRPPKPDATADEKTHRYDFLARGRRSIALNLKNSKGSALALRLVGEADALIEGFRPGVMERLGLGPEPCHARNPKLVYGRMTGWGQTGPLAHAAGHDLNYIAITGALWASGEAARPPSFPLNLLGDFGGGGMFLAFGLVSALLRAQRTGRGDVVDAAICDGTNTLMTFIHAMRAQGQWRDEREANLLDGGAPWYGVYACADGRWVTIAALEPQFWSCLLDLLGLDRAELGDRADRSLWPEMRRRLAETFLAKPRDHWVALLEGTDACFAPVLSPAEAARHPHMAARAAFMADEPQQPTPAPRFQRSEAPNPSAPSAPGADNVSILRDAGLRDDEIASLVADGVVSSAISRD